MKALKKDIQSVIIDLRMLTQKVEKIARELDKLEKLYAGKKPTTKVTAKVKSPKRVVVKKPRRITAIDTVFSIIKMSRKGVDITALKKKTNLEGRKINDIVYRLKKQHKIRSIRLGVYEANGGGGGRP